MFTFLTSGSLKKDLRRAFLSHFGSSLKGYGAMEWTFSQSLQRNNRPNFN